MKTNYCKNFLNKGPYLDGRTALYSTKTSVITSSSAYPAAASPKRFKRFAGSWEPPPKVLPFLLLPKQYYRPPLSGSIRIAYLSAKHGRGFRQVAASRGQRFLLSYHEYIRAVPRISVAFLRFLAPPGAKRPTRTGIVGVQNRCSTN